jgi:zinc transport system substrate-binding protein
MVVVTRAAEPVTRLAAAMRELVHDVFLPEDGERPVDGREADPLAALAQAGVNLLRCRVVWLRSQGLENEQPLLRRADADADEALERLGGFSFFACHADDYDTSVMRLIVIFILMSAMASCLAGCGAAAGNGSGRERVVASFYPLAFAAEQIGGPDVDVENLTPPGAEPHDLEVSPQDIANLRSADLVLLLGRGFQPQLEDAAGSGDRVLSVLDTPGLDVRANNDPHVWLDPVRYAKVVARIGESLGRPGTAARLEQRLRDLDGEFSAGLAHCRRPELVTSHEAFGYLAERYGLEQIAITGLSPESEPEPSKLQAVVDLVRERGVTTIYFETLVSPRIAETVARGTGAKTAVLDPIEGLTEEEAAHGDDYFTLMRRNLASLQEGLGCR